MLSIITIGKDNIELVQLTIDSIAENVRAFKAYEIELILVLRDISSAELIIPTWINSTVIENKDRSIYHAMNIGWDAAKGNHLWFLNSGDRAVFAESFLPNLAKFPKSAHSFAVRLIGEIYNFQSDPYKKNLHPGFIFPNCDLRYIDSGRLDADALVISEVLNRYNVQYHNDIISAFTLDGVSNQISLKQLPSRLGRGLLPAVALFLKWSFYLALPRVIFWRFWAIKNGHKRVSK